MRRGGVPAGIRFRPCPLGAPLYLDRDQGGGTESSIRLPLVMRRYGLISMAIGGGAALVTLALYWGGIFEGASERIWAMVHAGGASADALRLRALEIPLLALASPAVAWGVVEATRNWQKALVAGLAVGVLALFAPTLALYGIRFDFLAPVTAALLAALGGFVFGRTEAGRRKRLLEDALGSRVSTKLFDRLLEGAGGLPIEGETREVTTLVCRLLPSADPKEMPSPADRLKMGSLFLRSVSSFLLSRGAYLESVGPECVRATFGMVGDEAEPAQRACLAALDLRSRLKSLAQECDARWFLALRAGVGLSTGVRTVGLCGSPDRFFLSGMGGDEEFADRLALANARFGSDLLVSAETYRLVSNRFEMRPMELVYDPAKRSLAEIYQLLAATGDSAPEARARRDCFWRGVLHWRAGECVAALEQFSLARVPGVEDLPLDYMVARAQEGVVQPEPRSRRLVRELTEEGSSRLIQRL